MNKLIKFEKHLSIYTILYVIFSYLIISLLNVGVKKVYNLDWSQLVMAGVAAFWLGVLLLLRKITKQPLL